MLAVPSASVPFPVATGQMARLVRGHDWASTPLGQVDHWPATLRAALETCFASAFPAFIWWGDDLLQFHNDAAIPIVGARFATSLGQPASRVWADVWRMLGPIAASVLATGETASGGELQFAHAHAGAARYAFSAAPVRDPVGQVVGVSLTVFETTVAARTASALREKEDALRESMQRYQLLFESATDGIWIADREGRLIDANPAACRLLGYTREQYVQLRVDDLIRPGLDAQRLRALTTRLAAGERVTDVWDIRGASGEYVTLELSHAFTADGHWQASGRDVTERHRVELALRQSEERYRSLFEAMGQGYARLVMERDAFGRALDYRYVEVNPAFERLTGLPVASALGRLGREVLPDIEPWWIETYDRILRSGRPEAFEHEVASLGRWYIVYVYPDERDRFTVLYEDITERKQAEQALRASEALLGAALTSVPVGIGVLDRRGEVVLSNPVLRQYLPTARVPSRDVVRGWRWRAWHPDGTPVEPQDFPAAKALRGESTLPGLEAIYVDDDGRETWARVAGVPVRDGDDQVTGAMVVITDIDALKRGAETLRENAARQAYIVRLGDAVRPLDDPAAIRNTASRVLREQLGADRVLYTEAHGAEELDFVATDRSPGMPELPVRRVRTADYGAALAAEFRAGRTTFRNDVRDDPANSNAEMAAFAALRIRAWANVPLVKGGRLVAMVSAHFSTPHAWSAGELVLLEETAERTWAAVERARAEAALRDADRRKDEFLATLAHELRNPLAPIRNGLQIARRTDSTDPTFGRVLDMMERQLSHLVRLVDDLLDIGRISAGKIELRRARVRLADVLATGIEGARAKIEAHGHEFSVAPVPEEFAVDGDFHRLAQVFSNLLTNAAKYTSRGGRIRVFTTAEDGAAVVRVIDNGIGIPHEDLSRVFDLFSQVRTHQGLAEGGLGIGLALARRLVEMHGGTIEVSSAGSGLGSTFCVRLPLTRAARADVDDAHRGDLCVSVNAGRRVLVVDDNVDAAESLAAILSREGHELRLAHDGRAAIAGVAEFRPDVVILDLGMPDMDGVEVAKSIGRLPGARPACLIALTGWGQDADKRRTREAGFDWHLVKPADPAQILRLLREAGPAGS